LQPVVEYIKAKDLNLIGTQENEPVQRAAFERMLPENYAFWPRQGMEGDDGKRSSNMLIYDKDDFREIEAGFVEGAEYFFENDMTPPFVVLEDKLNGQRFVFMNSHEPADVNGHAADSRENNAQLYREKFIEWAEEQGLPIVYTTDLNSMSDTIRGGMDDYHVNSVAELPYQILTNNNLVQDTCVMVLTKANCSSTYGDKKRRVVEFVFAGAGLKAINYTYAIGPMLAGATDHPFPTATLEIPYDLDLLNSGGKG
jgi:hypothetical protein